VIYLVDNENLQKERDGLRRWINRVKENAEITDPMDQYHETNPPTELKSAVMGREKSRKGAPSRHCQALPWVDAARNPLADVVGGEYTIFAGHETLRLFAIRMRRGDFEYQLGTVDDGGTILDVDGNDTGRQVWDAAFYFQIFEPNESTVPTRTNEQ